MALNWIEILLIALALIAVSALFIYGPRPPMPKPSYSILNPLRPCYNSNSTCYRINSTTSNITIAKPEMQYLNESSFHIFTSCLLSSTPPFAVSADEFFLPYPPVIPPANSTYWCDYVLNDVDEIGSQTQRGFSFWATFVTSATAPYSFDEEVVTSVDDNVNWTGQEYGFRTSMQDGVIYGYVQNGTKKLNQINYFYSIPLMQNDGKQHFFLANETTNGTNNTFNFYIDSQLKGRIVLQSSVNFSNQSYHLIITTHRWNNSWDSYNSSLTVKNISIIK